MQTPAFPKLDLQPLPIGSLIPDPKNARQHPDRHVRQLAKSIQTFGFNCPVLIDVQNHVIAGHGRLLAAKFLDWSEVPTIRLEHLTPDQVRAYRIADNRLTDCSTWDDRLLAEQLKVLSEAELDFDLDAIGFDLPEIDFRIQRLDEIEEGADELFSVDSSAEPVSRIGDVWQLGPHRIVCGNALLPETYATLMAGALAAVVFTDPPYNVPIAGHVSGNGAIQHPEFPMASGELSPEGFTDFLRQALREMRRTSVAGALIYACMDWRHVGELLAAGDAAELSLKNLCVWDKGTGGMGSLYRSQHELVFVFKAGEAAHTNNVQLGRFGRNRTNVWRYPGINSFARSTGEGNLLALHPTVKPVALIADVLLDASQRGEIVLDPFLGSGSTLIAAEQTGRIAYGIELDPRYVDVAIQRWQRRTEQSAVLVENDEPFEAVMARRAAGAVDEVESQEVAP